jgi:hypothetical protein
MTANATTNVSTTTASLGEALVLLDAGLHHVWAADPIVAEIEALAAARLDLPEEFGDMVRRWARSADAVRMGLLAAEAACSELEEQLRGTGVVGGAA